VAEPVQPVQPKLAKTILMWVATLIAVGLILAFVYRHESGSKNHHNYANGDVCKVNADCASGHCTNEICTSQ
jgi:hypothetical protein